MIIKKYILIIFLFIIILPECQDHDITGKIVIEYDNSWSAVISHNHSDSNVNGTGKQEFSYKNPDRLSVTVTKQDSSNNKLTAFIYEDERITAAGSTTEPGGSVTIEYEFPY
jgi:hypothetical protein